MKLNNSTKSTGLKLFKPNPNVKNGICTGYLEKVEVTETTISDDSPMSTLVGQQVPRLSFIFKSYGDPVGVKQSTYIHSYNIIEHTPENVDNPWLSDAMASTIKHFHEVLSGREDMTDAEIKMVNWSLEETDAEGFFKEQPIEKVIESWNKFFNGVALLFNGKGDKAMPLYKDAKGAYKVLNMKLLLYANNKAVNQGSPGFTTRPGQGLIELYKQGAPSELFINVAKGESIVPRPPVPTPNGGMQGAMQGAIPGATMPTQGLAPSDIPNFANTAPF
jgi:hypothetical protein